MAFITCLEKTLDPKFTCKFRKHLFKSFKTQLRFSSSFHLETDGEMNG